MPKKILIIEDEKYLAEMYKWKLEKEGYITDFALDGQAGVKKALAMNPDMILLDLVMPVMDGYKTLEILRQTPSTKNTPIYIFSNLGQVEEVEKGMHEGANGFLVKAALTPTDLVKKIELVLAGKKDEDNIKT